MINQLTIHHQRHRITVWVDNPAIVERMLQHSGGEVACKVMDILLAEGDRGEEVDST